MKNDKEVLIKAIETFLDSNLDVKTFWENYHFYYADIPDNSISLTNYDWKFFNEVNELLYHTDWKTPSNTNLNSPYKLKEWLTKNFQNYLNERWIP